VFQTLERGGHKWLADIVLAFNHGDIPAYRELRAAHKAQIQSIVRPLVVWRRVRADPGARSRRSTWARRCCRRSW
jgi:hypothetical protein